MVLIFWSIERSLTALYHLNRSHTDHGFGERKPGACDRKQRGGQRPRCARMKAIPVEFGNEVSLLLPSGVRGFWTASVHAPALSSIAPLRSSIFARHLSPSFPLRKHHCSQAEKPLAAMWEGGDGSAFFRVQPGSVFGQAMFPQRIQYALSSSSEQILLRWVSLYTYAPRAKIPKRRALRADIARKINLLDPRICIEHGTL